MKCKYCREEVLDTNKFCPNCGAEIQMSKENEDKNETPNETVSAVENVQRVECRNMQEFYKAFAKKDTKSWVIAFVVCCYITVVMCGISFYWMDMFAYAVMGTWMLVRKHWIPSLVISIWCFVGMIITLVADGTLGGWFCLLASIISTIRIMRLQKGYKKYCADGNYPEQLY